MSTLFSLRSWAGQRHAYASVMGVYMNPYLTAKVRGKQCKIRILGQILQAEVSSKVYNVTVLLSDNPNRDNPASASILNLQANKQSQSVQEPTAAELESFILNGPSPQPIVPTPEVNTEVAESVLTEPVVGVEATNRRLLQNWNPSF